MDKTPAMSGTRAAVLAAFRDLLLERGYERMRVLDLVERSGVGRSTFYEHFQSRDDVLRDSVRVPLAGLAALVTGDAQPPNVEVVLQHFWQNRPLARALLGPGCNGVLTEVLAEMIEAQLPPAHRMLPLPLVARQIAHAQLGLIAAWVDGAGAATAADVAQTLIRTTKALSS